MALSRKHYIELAGIIRATRQRFTSPEARAATDYIQQNLAEFLRRDNSGFNATRFHEAAEVQTPLREIKTGTGKGKGAR